MVLHGACHCRNITFALTWEPNPAEIPARACTCSFCAKHGGVWTAYPRGFLRVKVADPALVSRYSFETRTAEFHVCSKCGVVPVATSRIDGRVYAVVNVNTFEDIGPSLLRSSPASFDGEDEASRLERRTRNWIGDVAFVET
jgi:hypothetical protein